MHLPNGKLSELEGGEEKLIQQKPFGFLRDSYENKTQVFGIRKRDGVDQFLIKFIDESPVWINHDSRNYFPLL